MGGMHQVLLCQEHQAIHFGPDIAKKQTSRTRIMQWRSARICSILRNSQVKLDKNVNFSVLVEKEEIILNKKLLQFPWILNICLNTQDPYMITVYLQELAELFHKFYDQHRVLTDDSALTQARLALIDGVKIVIGTGLNLLGISCPQKM